MSVVAETLRQLEQELGVSLNHISIIFSVKGLRPWELACCWVEQPEKPVIQLRPQLERGSYFGYTLREVIRHEVVHALRAHLPYSQFEELLACHVAMAQPVSFFGRLRRNLSALFFRSWEPIVFLGLSLLPPLFDYSSFAFLPLITAIIFLGVRLWFEWVKFNQLLKRGSISRILFFV